MWYPGSQPLSAPHPPRLVHRADGAEHRHRAATRRYHRGAHRGWGGRQRPRQGGLLQPQVPARRLLLRWVRPRPGWGPGSGVRGLGFGRGRRPGWGSLPKKGSSRLRAGDPTASLCLLGRVGGPWRTEL